MSGHRKVAVRRVAVTGEGARRASGASRCSTGSTPPAARHPGHCRTWWPAARSTSEASSNRSIGTRTRVVVVAQGHPERHATAASGATIALSIPVACTAFASSPFHRTDHASSSVSARRITVDPSGPNTTARTSRARNNLGEVCRAVKNVRSVVPAKSDGRPRTSSDLPLALCRAPIAS